ncbi:MAG: hypothetical protein LBS48_04670 [Treponema sp.]|jgi:hypothetical protein|nr:hypothetical protein [Treponema sp.]
MKRLLCFAVFPALMFASCSTLMDKSGRVLDGSALEKKEISLYRSEGTGKDRAEVRVFRLGDGEEMLAVTSGAYPGLELQGTLPSPDGAFDLTGLEFLSSHVQGWNEFTLGLLGSACFSAKGGTGELSLERPAERVQIVKGDIRLKSRRIGGDQALQALGNRRERILALTEWMHSRPPGEGRLFRDQKEFESYWKPRLFPELVSKKKRPPEWNNDAARQVRADSVKWNRDYTELVFPEELWELRNSGAMLRDWEEALAWIYLEYSWDSVFASLNRITLMKIK